MYFNTSFCFVSVEEEERTSVTTLAETRDDEKQHVRISQGAMSVFYHLKTNYMMYLINIFSLPFRGFKF